MREGLETAWIVFLGRLKERVWPLHRKLVFERHKGRGSGEGQMITHQTAL